MARKIIGSYFRLLFLRSIHDELMRKMTEVENLRERVRRKEEELQTRIAYACQRTKGFRKAPRHLRLSRRL